jgi:hypothetical protein
MTAPPLFRHHNAVQVKVTLDDIEPPIWRRLVVPMGFHLGHLHLVVQAAFNWWNYHLHEFRIGGLSYGAHEQVGEPESDDDRRFFDEAEVRLRDFDHWSGRRFLYLYDFGDGWRHTVELEKPLVLDPAPLQASCLDGARARPPEDVADRRGTRPSLRSWPTAGTLSMRKPGDGAAGISTGSGSTWIWSARMCAEP